MGILEKRRISWRWPRALCNVFREHVFWLVNILAKEDVVQFLQRAPGQVLPNDKFEDLFVIGEDAQFLKYA